MLWSQLQTVNRLTRDREQQDGEQQQSWLHGSQCVDNRCMLHTSCFPFMQYLSNWLWPIPALLLIGLYSFPSLAELVRIRQEECWLVIIIPSRTKTNDDTDICGYVIWWLENRIINKLFIRLQRQVLSRTMERRWSRVTDPDSLSNGEAGRCAWRDRERGVINSPDHLLICQQRSHPACLKPCCYENRLPFIGMVGFPIFSKDATIPKREILT